MIRHITSSTTFQFVSGNCAEKLKTNCEFYIFFCFRQECSGDGRGTVSGRVKSVINNLKDLTARGAAVSASPPPPSIQPRASPGEMAAPAPARPPKTQSSQASVTLVKTQSYSSSSLLGDTSTSSASSGSMRTSTPAPALPETVPPQPQPPVDPSHQQTVSSKAKLRSHTKLTIDNFEYFASGLQQQQPPQPQQKEQSKVQPRYTSTVTPKMPHFISLRSLPGPAVPLTLARSRSPSPPPPPSSGPNSLKLDPEADSLPPPPSYSTLKRLSTYRR